MGFLNKLTEWFSEENVARQQQRLQAWWETHRKQGWRHVIMMLPKGLWKLFWVMVGVVLLVIIGVAVVTGFYWALIFAAVPVALIALRRFEAASYAILPLSALGVLGFAVNHHFDGLYGALILVSVFAAFRISRRALYVVGGFVLAAFVVWLAVSIITLIPDQLVDVPDKGIIHAAWVVLGIVAVAVAFLATGRSAGTLVAVAFAAAGYSQFVWGYAGFREQEPILLGQLAQPDQLFYGLLFMVVGVVLLLPLASGAPGEKPGEPLSDQARDLLQKLYELDKQTRVFTVDGARFLVSALRRAGVTQEELDDADVTIKVYGKYAAQAAIDEIRESGIVRKDGTVNPNKLAKLGFRPGFLEDHEITKEELLTGKPIDDESED